MLFRSRRAYRGNCPGQDQRHIFVLNAVFTSPKFADRKLSLLASGWQVAPILQIHSGSAFTVTAGSDQSLTTIPGQTANQLAQDPYATNKGQVNGIAQFSWLNPASFAVPALGTTSSLGYGNLQGPSSVQLNVALSRTFKIREHQTIQLRSEAFNLQIGRAHV